MKILKLHHPTGHPYWQADEYMIELPSGEIINPKDFIEPHSSYKVYVTDMGVFVRAHHCSQGGGKTPVRGSIPLLLVGVGLYDKIEYVGTPLTISQELANDLKDNKLS